MAWTWEDLAGRALARQFPGEAATETATCPGADDVVAMVERTGPVQSQTARSPFLGLGARFPGVTREAVTAAYESGGLVRGSTIRGTVHTATAAQFAGLGAATAIGQRTSWQRILKLEKGDLDDLWRSTEEFAADWRTPAELTMHLHDWLVEHEGEDRVTALPVARFLAFGHGGLVRRPANGDWVGQGAPLYRTLPPAAAASATDAVLTHLHCHGPASRHDVAWWSGMGLRVVDAILEDLTASHGLVAEPGPDGRTYLALPECAEPIAVPGVRLLPEFDALMCGYDPPARERFADPTHLRRLWIQNNGLVLPPVLVDGRITGYWRATGSARRRPLEVVWFAGTRRPRAAELDSPVAALEAALGIEVTAVTITREAV